MTSVVPPPVGNGQLVVRISGGDELAIDLATIETVGEVKYRVCEAYGQKPDVVQIFCVHGEQVADERLVSSLITMELNIIFAENPTPTVNHIPLREPAHPTAAALTAPVTSRMRAKMALTGQVLNVELDTTLSVGAVRQQIAAALGTCDEHIALMGPDGVDLSDVLALDTLGFSDVCVLRRQRSIVLGPRQSNVLGPAQHSERRLRDELRKFTSSAPSGFAAGEADPSAEGSIFCWRVYFPWPENMPHQEERCEIIMRFPFTYPYNPPEVLFVANVPHWAVASNGKALMDILDAQWSPALTGRSVAVGLHSLLHEAPKP